MLIENIDLYKFYNVINFYSGLILNSDEILLEANFSLMKKIKINDKKIEEYIQLYYGNDNKINDSSLCINMKSDEQINSELDSREESEYVIEDEYDNITDINLDDRKNDVFSSLLLLCNVLRNSEYVSTELKNESLEYCLDCYSFISSPSANPSATPCRTTSPCTTRKPRPLPRQTITSSQKSCVCSAKTSCG